MMCKALHFARGLMLVIATVSCTVRPGKLAATTTPQQPPPAVPALSDPTDAGGASSAQNDPASSTNEAPPPPPLPLATEADGSPRPYVTAELTSFDGYDVLGLTLTVLATPTRVAGGFEPSYPAPSDDPRSIAGAMISPRWYRMLAWEQVHGSFEGYVPGPEADAPEPSFTFTGLFMRQPMELLVFGDNAYWRATVHLLPCSKKPCPKYVSPVDSVVIVVSGGTAERLGIGEGWSIAIDG